MAKETGWRFRSTDRRRVFYDAPLRRNRLCFTPSRGWCRSGFSHRLICNPALEVGWGPPTSAVGH